MERCSNSRRKQATKKSETLAPAAFYEGSGGRLVASAVYMDLKTKSTGLFSLAPMVTCWVDVPSFSCQALMV